MLGDSRLRQKALHQLLNVNELFDICASGHLFPPPVHAGASVKVRLPS